MSALPAAARPRWRDLVLPGLCAGIVLALLVGLGTWQLQRLQWKEALIERIEARIHAPPEPLPESSAWAGLDPAAEEYRHVTVTGLWEPQEALIFRGSGKVAGAPDQPGYWVIAPLQLADGATVLVNRGFVPLDRRADPARRPPGGEVIVTGLLRAPEERNPFTPPDDPASGQWYTRDPVAIGSGLGLTHVAGFSIDEDAHAAPAGTPPGGATVLDIPNNHLSYAVTWYGLALTLVGVFMVFALRRPAA